MHTETTAEKHAFTKKLTWQTMPLYCLLGFCKNQVIEVDAEKGLTIKDVIELPFLSFYTSPQSVTVFYAVNCGTSGKKDPRISKYILQCYHEILFISFHISSNTSSFYTISPALILFTPKSLHKKWSFPLRFSSVNLTKSVVSCGFSHIY